MTDLKPLDIAYDVGTRLKVRRLAGVFEVTGSRMIGALRRYQLKAVPETGCILEGTEAYGRDMEPMPDPEPAPELSLAVDPPTVYSDAQGLPDASPYAAAPAGERSAAGTVCSPGAGITLNEDGSELEEFEPFRETTETEMQQLASVDHTHDPEGPGEEDGPWAAGWEERSGKRKKLRRPPVDMTDYHQLKDIMYSGRFRGMEDSDDDALAQLDMNTPVGVAATRERNGSAVWIIVVQGMLRKAVLEAFYPNDAHDESSAVEHAVMLALREVPIRTPDLEVLLLQLG